MSKTTNGRWLAATALILVPALPLHAQDASRFSWEGEIELGYESLYDSAIPANEDDVAYGNAEFAAELALSDSVSIFGGLTFEEVEDGAGSTGYGFYIHELGLQFGIGIADVKIGKVAPTFGTAWDSAAGFFASSLAEDYELTEQIGILADIGIGNASALSLGVFYADNTALSESAGFNRGRNSDTAGGAGNTGELNNVALQWTTELDNTYFYLGARYLSAGTGDVSDETGVVAGFGHSFAAAGAPIDVFAEVASFEGFGGSADDATYATLNLAYTLGDWTLSGTLARRDIDSAGETDLVTLAAEYEFGNGVLIGAGWADVDDAGTSDQIFGINVIFPLGG